jgi:hypothetical protein
MTWALLSHQLCSIMAARSTAQAAGNLNNAPDVMATYAYHFRKKGEKFRCGRETDQL